jgi:hypothetical protein
MKTEPSDQHINHVVGTNLLIDTVLFDQMTDDSTPEIKAQVQFKNGQIWIKVDGYGDCISPDGYGFPIGVELADGELRVVVWSDINQEDSTHIIGMDDAKDTNRKE